MPTDEEINKTIAEFMGIENWDSYKLGEMGWYERFREDGCPLGFQMSFTQSLDELIPVVSKLLSKNSGYRLQIEFDLSGCCAGVGDGYPECFDYKEDKSPSKALALAVYEVIKNGN